MLYLYENSSIFRTNWVKYRAMYACIHILAFRHTTINTHTHITPSSLYTILFIIVCVHHQPVSEGSLCSKLARWWKEGFQESVPPSAHLKLHCATVVFYLHSYYLNELNYDSFPRVRGNLESLLIESWGSYEMSVLLWALLFPEAWTRTTKHKNLNHTSFENR